MWHEYLKYRLAQRTEKLTIKTARQDGEDIPPSRLL